MKSYFVEMLAFEAWANEKLLAWLEAHASSSELIRIFAHIVAENHPWLYLLRGEQVPSDVNPEPEWTIEECREQLGPTMQALRSFVAFCSDGDLLAVVRSSTPSGVIFENTVTEVLTHLLNHSEHHRGQMLWIISKETGEYVPSLYMPYLRKGRPVRLR